MKLALNAPQVRRNGLSIWGLGLVGLSICTTACITCNADAPNPQPPPASTLKLRVVLGQTATEFSVLNRSLRTIPSLAIWGGSGLIIKESGVEVDGPELDLPMLFSNDPGVGSVSVEVSTSGANKSTDSQVVESIHLLPGTSNNKPEAAEHLLDRMLEVLRKSPACQQRERTSSWKREMKGDERPTVQTLTAVLHDGRTWWTSWEYRCGGVEITVSLEKYPVWDPAVAEGYIVTMDFEAFSHYQALLDAQAQEYKGHWTHAEIEKAEAAKENLKNLMNRSPSPSPPPAVPADKPGL